jgi:hypothetical protein
VGRVLHAGKLGRLVEYRAASAADAGAVPIDYRIRGASTSLRVRRALLFYALRRLALDVAADVRPASEQHIGLVNRAEVEAASVRAPQASISRSGNSRMRSAPRNDVSALS